MSDTELLACLREQGAIFDQTRVYRYALWREWNPLFISGDFPQYVLFICLNPSTADEAKNDPTIRRCIAYARQWGYSALVMANLFAHRATVPQTLLCVSDPIGPENDAHLKTLAERAELTVAAWGGHCSTPARAQKVQPLLSGRTVCLGLTKSGAPLHPLYVKKEAVLQPFIGETP